MCMCVYIYVPCTCLCVCMCAYGCTDTHILERWTDEGRGENLESLFKKKKNFRKVTENLPKGNKTNSEYLQRIIKVPESKNPALT